MASLTVIQDFERRQMDAITAKRRVPEFAPGDTVKVMVKVIEDVEDAKGKKKGGPKPKVEDKGPGFRLQAYEGVVIARSGAGINESFTVRKISYGEGVERVFPIYSPYIAEIEVMRRGKVRRAKLYYLRGRRGKSARIFERTDARAKRLNAAFKGFKRPKGEADDLTRIKGVTPSWRASSMASASSSSTRSPISPTTISPMSTRRWRSAAASRRTTGWARRRPWSPRLPPPRCPPQTTRATRKTARRADAHVRRA